MQGAVETLEREMLAAFTDRPDHVIVWKMDNGFFRGLLHGICQYHNLRSCSMCGARRLAPLFPPFSFRTCRLRCDVKLEMSRCFGSDSSCMYVGPFSWL
jgi:hypothetical protein